MPELPEVETVRLGLIPALEGATLARVRINRPDLRFPFPEGFGQRLTGARVLSLGRRGKFLLAPLDRDETLVMHLGMSGRFEVTAAGKAQRPGHFVQAPAPDKRHAHVEIETEVGARVVFYDPRRFGFMDLVASEGVTAHPWFSAMGPEPLEAGFDAALLAKAFAGRRQGPKTLLLDQRIVAGLGNIYVSEALHRARISPLKPAGSIGRAKVERLVEAVRAVLAEAIEAGGSSLKDHAQVDGALGYFQHRFRAYDREGEPCPTPRCRGVIRREVQAGRSTFHCPVCQR